ncbi:MAG TPA: hypothetical protein EYM84_10310, partial [Flavobacteriales bacterium]|nr:hypothetical protein [Flavobacteriales bacterium]
MRAIITSLLTIYIIVISEAQEYNFDNPIKLGIAVNSESEESSVLLSPNSNRLYFSRIGHTKNSGGMSGGQDIWYCDKKEEEWLEASNVLKNINNKGNNAIIGMSIGEDTVYLLNNYKGKKTTIGVSYSVKEGLGWSIPQSLNIPDILSSKGYYGFNMHPNGQILIISMNLKNSIGNEDLYVSFNEGNNTWSALIHLGEVINSKGFEITPFISNDGRKLYFSSDGHGGLGNADIFVSTRIDESWTNWTEPVNLGEKINSIGFDASFSIWRDSLVYFCSNRSGIMSDVFQSKLLKPLEHIEEFQEIVNLANNT